MDENQMEMQVRVMALELAIKAKNPETTMAELLANAQQIVSYIRGV
jgi:hypothetical protein